jgi:hypothetical protein
MDFHVFTNRSPECDRSFTRSDALAKHMRTVHETEALRPSDPIPKSQQSSTAPHKSSKLRIVLKGAHGADASGQDDVGDDSQDRDDYSVDFFTPLTEEQGFNSKEQAMPLERLYSLCRMQVKWAERDGDELTKEWKEWEELYRQEWLEKEILLDQVIKSELDWSDRRRAVLSGQADLQLRNEALNGTVAGKTGSDGDSGRHQRSLSRRGVDPESLKE